jgi:hypothetical protein
MSEIIEKEVEKKFNQLLERIPDILKKEKKRDENDFFNFSVIELYNNTMRTMIDIINDVIHVFDNYNKNNYLTALMEIFFNEKRLFYIGIVLIILSFVIYFIDGATI